MEIHNVVTIGTEDSSIFNFQGSIGYLLGAAVGLIEGAVEGALLVLSEGDFVDICLLFHT